MPKSCTRFPCPCCDNKKETLPVEYPIPEKYPEVFKKTIFVVRCVCGNDVYSDMGLEDEACWCGRTIKHHQFEEKEVANITKETLPETAEAVNILNGIREPLLRSKIITIITRFVGQCDDGQELTSEEAVDRLEKLFLETLSSRKAKCANRCCSDDVDV